MSYLQLDAGLPDFTKLVLSLWFRVPQASTDAAAAAWTGADGAMFDGIIPLVVLGKKGKGDTPVQVSIEEVLAYEGTQFTVIGITGGTFDYEQIGGGQCEELYGPFSYRVEGTLNVNLGASVVPGQPSHGYVDQRTIYPTGPGPDLNPSFIGLDCTGGLVTLFVNFETAQVPVVSEYAFNEAITPGESRPRPGEGPSFQQGTRITQWCSEPFGLLIDPVGETEPEEISDTVTTVTAPSGTYTGDYISSYTDISGMIRNATGAIHNNVNSIAIMPDHWHHLLVSVDLQTIESHGGEADGDIVAFVDGASKLFVAVDDVNYTGLDLSNNWVQGGDLNAVISDGAFEIAGTRPPIGNDGEPLGTPHYTLSSPKVPNNGEPLGVPATTQFVGKILPVEMAELQIFTGVSVDTGVMSNRRAFIDGDGKPVSPSPPPVDGELPTPPAETLLGKKPEILLHGSGKWIAGTNTGAPAAPLVPTGKIIAYSPDPSLHGPQGSAA